jgi:hypothetical protein
MTDVACRDFIVALAGLSGAGASTTETGVCDRVWSDAAISGLTQVMQAFGFDYWIEQPLRLADFVA